MGLPIPPIPRSPPSRSLVGWQASPADNTVRHDQIAEARIVYGGRGTLSDIQQPRYGQEVFDIIYPI